MQSQRSLAIRQYEDIQVDYIDCCTTVIHKVDSSKQNIQRYDSQKLLKHSRQKGISLASKSAHRLPQYQHTPLKLNIRSTDQQHQMSIRSSLRDQQLQQMKFNELLPTNNNSKKILRVQRCIDYKNKKILEHHHNKNGHEHTHFDKKQKDNGLQSTRKNTFRTCQESFILLNTKNAESFFEQPAADSITCNSKQLTPQSKLQIEGGRMSQRTLSRLYEQSKGMKCMTVQSVQSESGDFQSGKQSIIEPFSFNNTLSA